MIDFVELFNRVAQVAKPAHPDFNNATSMDDKMSEIDIDSLDGLLMMMFLCELYGIDTEQTKDWYPTTIQEVYDLLQANKTTEPTSIEEAIKAIK
jgi:acyl carrier protein